MPGTMDYTREEGENQNDGDFLPIKDGDYLFQITGAISKTSSKGDPMIEVTFQGLDEEVANRKLWDRIVFPHPNSPSRGIIGRSVHFLHCIGEAYESPLNWDELNWAWKKAKIKVGTRKYKDKDQNYVVKYILDESLNPAINVSDEELPF